MATVQDSQIQPPKPYWKIALDLVYRLLGVAKSMNLFSKK